MIIKIFIPPLLSHYQKNTQQQIIPQYNSLFFFVKTFSCTYITPLNFIASAEEKKLWTQISLAVALSVVDHESEK